MSFGNMSKLITHVPVTFFITLTWSWNTNTFYTYLIDDVFEFRDVSFSKKMFEHGEEYSEHVLSYFKIGGGHMDRIQTTYIKHEGVEPLFQQQSMSL